MLAFVLQRKTKRDDTHFDYRSRELEAAIQFRKDLQTTIDGLRSQLSTVQKDLSEERESSLQFRTAAELCKVEVERQRGQIARLGEEYQHLEEEYGRMAESIVRLGVKIDGLPKLRPAQRPGKEESDEQTG